MKYLSFLETQLYGLNPYGLKQPLTLVSPVLPNYYVEFLKDLF